MQRRATHRNQKGSMERGREREEPRESNAIITLTSAVNQGCSQLAWQRNQGKPFPGQIERRGKEGPIQTAGNKTRGIWIWRQMVLL